VPNAQLWQLRCESLVGDLLFGKASELVAELGPEAVKIQAQTFVRLCSGQIRDARPAPEGVDPIDYYFGVLADKDRCAHRDGCPLWCDVSVAVPRRLSRS